MSKCFNFLRLDKNINIPVIKTISDKSVVWFQQSNQYVVMNSFEAEVLLKICNKEKLSNITEWCIKKLSFAQNDADVFIQSIQDLISQQRGCISNKSDNYTEDNSYSKIIFDCQKCYKISDKVFFVEYETAELEYLIHPKFAHLEVKNTNNSTKHFQVYSSNKKFILKVDNVIIGEWDEENLHFLSGKFSMELLNNFYDKTENDWMAVMHASAISDGENCILFAGDSGSGKSTAAAILMASNFHLIADDFVPIDTSCEIKYFPAALSVKKQALNVLSKKFPELNTAKEIHFKQLNKTVRYLTPNQSLSVFSYPAKAIIFIKYQENSIFKLNEMPTIDALQEFIPDTWILPVYDNVEKFLNWFSKMSFYQLTYSDNNQLVSEVKNLFND